MSIEKVLMGNNIKANSLNSASLKKVDYVNDNNEEISNVLFVPLKDNISCKMENDNSCTFYNRSDMNKDTLRQQEIGILIEGAKVVIKDIDNNGKSEAQAVVTVSSDKNDIVVTPYIANNSVSNLEMVRNYGKPVVFSGDMRGELLQDYLNSNQLNDKKVKENIVKDIESVPVIISEENMKLLKFKLYSDLKDNFGKVQELPLHSFDDVLNNGSYSYAKGLKLSDFLKGNNALKVQRECYLDERNTYRNVMDLVVSDVKLKVDENGKKSYEFYVPFSNGEYNQCKASYIKWNNDAMRKVELEAGLGAMNYFRNNLSVLRLYGNDMIDYEATNNDIDNKKAGFKLDNVELSNPKFEVGYSNVSTIANFVRDTGSLDGSMNIHLKFTHNNEEWKLKVPAKSLYTFSCKHNLSIKDTKGRKDGNIKDFCIAVNKDEMLSLDILEINNKNKSEILHIDGKASELLPNIVYPYDYAIDYDKTDMMKDLTKFMEHNRDKIFQPLSIKISADNRKNVLYGSKENEKFIVLRNLGKNFSARLECSSVDLGKDGSLTATVKPMQALTISINKEPVNISICDKKDLDRIIKINNELGQTMGVTSSKTQKTTRKRQTKTKTISKSKGEEKTL